MSAPSPAAPSTIVTGILAFVTFHGPLAEAAVNAQLPPKLLYFFGERHTEVLACIGMGIAQLVVNPIYVPHRLVF